MPENEPERGYGINRDDLDLVSRTVLRLGGYAEGLFDFHEFGFDKAILRNHITNVHGILTDLKQTGTFGTISLRPPDLPAGAFIEDHGDSWNYLQTLRLAAGAAMLSERCSSRMTRENLIKAMTAKIFQECETNILDDLVDRSRYSYLEAKDLYHIVFSSMIDPDYDSTIFMKSLVAMLKREQMPLFNLINSMTHGYNVLWNTSPHGDRYFYEMEILNERVALGQALTMFQKESSLGIPKMERIAETFHAPGEGWAWWEKLAAHVSSSGRYNLVDMAFSNEAYDPDMLKAFLSGWYYYDASIVLLDHVASIYKDLRNGLANLSLIAMREKEVAQLTSLQGYNPQLTIDDFDMHLRRIATLTSRGLRLVDTDPHHEEHYYPFITIMMPVVMMADWIGNRD
ncbi:MAG: hypothetical protein ACT4OI_00320, partial [Methanobacteriota archaeon]